MESRSPSKKYKFGDLFNTMLRTRLIQRKSKDSPFELRDPKLIVFLISMEFFTITTILISVVNLFERESLADVSGNGAVVSVVLIIILRAFVILINRDVLKRLLTKLEQLFPTSSEDQLKYNLSKYLGPIIFRNKVMSLLMSYMIFAYVTMPFLKSAFFCIFRGQKYSFMYPFMDWFPIEDSVFWYIIIYCFHIAGGVSGILLYFYEDLSFTTAVTQLCMHYKFLCKSLSELDAAKESDSSRKLCKLIQLQNTLTLLRDDIDFIFSFSTFFAFTVVKISLCMFVFSLVKATSIDLANLLPYILSVCALMISVFQRCSIGTELYENSLNLTNSIYDSNWYEGTPKYRKMLVIMMIRTNRPIELQASPLNCIGIEYFKEVVMQTYNFLMFLINFSK